MKKYIIITIVMTLITLTGCMDKELKKYADTDEIKIETYSTETVARITITDTYKKKGVKYYIFTTDVSGDREFLMSEKDYGKYIGIENNAVDCTIYGLTIISDIFEYEYIAFPDRDLYADSHKMWDLIDETTDIDAYGSTLDPPNVFICEAYGKSFERGEYLLKSEKQDSKIKISSDFCLQRYSFAGEADFKENEINEYVEIIEMASKEIASKCSNLIEND